MSLKNSIIVVNEFSIKNASGGSRGGTPGNYVLRYMARDDAVEDLAPVRKNDSDTYITRYMARRDATETVSSVKDIKSQMKNVQGLGGIAFSADDVSLSDYKVRAISRDIQNEFEKGKTVFKTVISFEEDYLKSHNVIDKDFKLNKKGDYKGNVDQMKLRLAITEGLRRMSRNFDNLEWVGVIQVDTQHVHCHLCMVDKGKGTLMYDGTQRGKLRSNDLINLRRGIDLSLDRMAPVKMLASNVSYDRRNVRCFIKKYAHETMSERGLSQFLLSCLPPNKNLWRADTNDKRMRKANAVVKEYVSQLWQKPDSGYEQALAEIDSYADYRQQHEGLSNKERARIVQTGRKKLSDDCINGVYSVLKDVPSYDLSVKTPMLDVMSIDYETLASQDDPLSEFGFKFRSYSSRLQHHKKERAKYHEEVKSYERAKDDNLTSVQSQALYDFFKFEEGYNDKLVSKYQHFLLFLPNDDEYEDDFKNLMDHREKIRKMRLMQEDKRIRCMKPENAEAYGRRVFDVHGGQYLVTAPSVFSAHIDRMEVKNTELTENLRFKLESYGLKLDGDKITKGVKYDFEDVKALDLHHLNYDFRGSVNISKRNADLFVSTAAERYRLYQKAVNYLDRTDQGHLIPILNGRDVELMKQFSDKIRVEPVIESKIEVSDSFERSKTIRLDTTYDSDMQLAVKAAIQSVEFGE